MLRICSANVPVPGMKYFVPSVCVTVSNGCTARPPLVTAWIIEPSSLITSSIGSLSSWNELPIAPVLGSMIVMVSANPPPVLETAA